VHILVITVGRLAIFIDIVRSPDHDVGTVATLNMTQNIVLN
jgi:hypothetical protein